MHKDLDSPEEKTSAPNILQLPWTGEWTGSKKITRQEEQRTKHKNKRGDRKGTQVQFQTLATKNSIQQLKSDIDELTSQVMLRSDKLVGRCFDAEKEIGSLKSRDNRAA